MITTLFRLLLRCLFRFRAFHTDILDAPGPVLLLPNHVSWIDWMFLAAVLDDDWKFVVSRTSAETSWLHRKIMLNDRTFPIDVDSPYGVKRMAEFLRQNGRLVLFAEGRISRTGCLMKLFDGTGFLLHKTNAKVIVCYLRGAHRLPCSPNRDRHFWFPTVTAHFRGPLDPPHLEHASVAEARQRLTLWLRDRMVEHQFDTEMEFAPSTIPEAILETARQHPKFVVMGDMTNTWLSYRKILVGAHLLAREFERRLGRGRENVEPDSDAVRGGQRTVEQRTADRIGVLLPNVNATPVSLLALWLLGKTPAILNYSTGPATMLACVKLAGLTDVLTSKAFVEKARLDLKPLADAGVRFHWLEEIRQNISTRHRLAGFLRVIFRPRSILRVPAPAESTAIVLFTSGSEGLPKGVELTHTNLLANIRQMLAVCDMQDWDRLFNALPLFHSFGLAIGTLTPLVRGLCVFLYPSPLHYRLVPTSFYFSHSTILLATNTFLNGYARKAHPYDFHRLRYLFAGAEKVQEATAQTWAQRFGTRILEGYGATECSPCVSVCLAMSPKAGSAGRLLPRIECQLRPVDGVEEGGRLWVRGPNIMRGYLNTDANAEFKKLDGWYDTGDIVKVDDEGFLHVLGRLKRFAKISGEMVSLTAVEEALAGAFPKYGLRCQTAVISRPDEHKGEVLICVTNEPRLNLDEVRKVIRDKGLPNLCVPRDICYVKEIPKLGSGKVDHRSLAKHL